MSISKREIVGLGLAGLSSIILVALTSYQVVRTSDIQGAIAGVIVSAGIIGAPIWGFRARFDKDKRRKRSIIDNRNAEDAVYDNFEIKGSYDKVIDNRGARGTRASNFKVDDKSDES